MNPTILVDNKPIDPKSIFGKDADKVLSICNTLYLRELFPYEYGCPKNPAIHIGNIRPNNCRGKSLKECIKKWMNDHPTETEEYISAKEKWNDEEWKMRKAIYGIAKRKHVSIVWLGDNTVACMPDRFLIFKNGNSIGMIQC